jgi:hypothetical protein
MTVSVYQVTYRTPAGAFTVRVWATAPAQAKARARCAFALQPWVPRLPIDAVLEARAEDGPGSTSRSDA